MPEKNSLKKERLTHGSRFQSFQSVVDWFYGFGPEVRLKNMIVGVCSTSWYPGNRE
jgi:hypothetical protein